MSSEVAGRIRTDDCEVHREVVWNLDFEGKNANSPVFEYGDQRYQLRILKVPKYGDKIFLLFLARMGPACGFPERAVRWWAGYKLSDCGYYYYNNENGTLDVGEEKMRFTEVMCLKRLPQEEMERLATDRHLTFFLRLQVRRAPPAAEACGHGVTEVPDWGDGKVLMEACPFHTEFKWNVHYSSRELSCLVSPEFTFDRQRYRLELLESIRNYDLLELNLYRVGPSEKGDSGYVEWSAELKRNDEYYYIRYESGKLDLKLDCQLSRKVKTLVRVPLREMRFLFPEKEVILTVIFFLWNGSRTPTTGVCIHGAANISTVGDGLITKEECPIHKELVWNVHCRSVLRVARYLASPVFTVGNQQYRLELSYIYDICLSLRLFRKGPPIEGSVRWWTGLKHGDGTYCRRIESKNLDLRQTCDIWKDVGNLKTVTLSELKEEHLSVDEWVTVFFRVGKEKTSDAADACSHEAPEMFGRSSDSIREVESPSCKQIEWDVAYEAFPCYKSLSSPHFHLMNHCYMFKLYFEDGFLELYLLRSPRVDGTPGHVTFWAGLKCKDGTYNHRIERGKLKLNERHNYWQSVSLLKSISQGELEREHISPNGIATFFLRVDLHPLWAPLEARTLDVVIVPTRGEGVIEIEERSSFSHVDWTVGHPHEHRSVTSSEFRIGKQCFMLELSTTPEDICLLLYRKGPAVPDVRKARCWAGLKRRDGSYYHRNFKGKLKLHKDCKVWTMSRWLYSYSTFELERTLLSSCRKLIVFFRLNLCGTCEVFDSYFLSSLGDGFIREEDETSSKEVEWTVSFSPEVPYDWFSTSPEFRFGNQSFLLQMDVDNRARTPSIENFCPFTYVRLSLFRLGPQESLRIRWWAGLKRADRSYYFRTEREELKLEKGYEIWRWQQLLKKVELSELRMQHLIVDEKLTFFFLLALATAEVSCRSYVPLSSIGMGIIRQEKCSTHTEVDWDIQATAMENFGTVCSPEFQIREQRYLLELSKTIMWHYFNLYRMGPSVDGYIFFWAGLKTPDGAYYLRNKRKTLDLKEKCELWRKVKCVCEIFAYRMNRQRSPPLNPVKFFFRLSIERPSTGSEICAHGPAFLFSRGDGNIRVEECPSHKIVEWEIDPLLTANCNSTSPSFSIENQHYMLELYISLDVTDLQLNLYRMGPSVPGPGRSVRWWVGMTCLETADFRNRSGKLDLTEECEIWRKVELLRNVSYGEMRSGKPCTFTFCLSLQRSSNSMDQCVHVSRLMSVPRVGSIEEEEWVSCKQVEWHMDCALMTAEGRVLLSPEFSIGNQRFMMDLSCWGSHWEVHLFRRGSSGDCIARWYLGKSFAGVCDHQESKCGEMDLREACQLWASVENASLLVSEKLEPKKRIYLTIAFLLCWDQGSTTKEVSNSDTEVLQDSQRLNREDVVFKVQNKELKGNKAVLSIRVPALGAMFQHDTLENRTGVVHIEDCDSDIFEIFLKFVCTDELPDMTINEILSLFVLADKYLLEPLKSLCLRHIKYDTLPIETFSEVVKVICRHEGDDLLGDATKFLSCKKGIAQSNWWRRFKEKNSATAFDLEHGCLESLKNNAQRRLKDEI